MAKVLVSQLARMGDLTQSLYLLQDLKKVEGHHVSVLVDRRLEGFLLELAPWVDAVYPLDMEGYLRGFQDKSSWLDLWEALARELGSVRGVQFDRIINLNFGRLSGAVMSCFCGETPVDGFFPVPQGPCGDSWVETLSALVQTDRRWNRVHLVDMFRFYAGEQTPPQGFRARELEPLGSGSVLGIQVATRSPKRTWPLEAFVEVIRGLCRDPGPEIVLFGEQGEMNQAERIVTEVSSDRLVNLVGKTTLKDLIEVLGKCHCLLSGDTGTLHLAAWLGVPGLAIYFGPASLFETGPYGTGHTVVCAQRPCAPCHEDAHCPEGTTCGGSVTPETVLELLTGNSVSPRPRLQIYHSTFLEGWLQYRPWYLKSATPQDILGALYLGSLGELLGLPDGRAPSLAAALGFLADCYRFGGVAALVKDSFIEDSLPRGMNKETRDRLSTIMHRGWAQLKEMIHDGTKKEPGRIAGEPARGCQAG